VQPSENVPLAPLTTLGVGGPAQHFIVASDQASLLDALAWADRFGVRVLVLGGGSNVVVSDAGVDGLVVRIALRGVLVEEQDGAVMLTACAGEPWDALVERAATSGWAGIECLSGIPGMVGATPIQNVGAYGQEVAETISAVRAFDRKQREIVSLPPASCGFGYRDSLFKSGEPERFVVLSVTYRLTPNGPPGVRYPELARRLAERGIERPTLLELREQVLDLRRSKSMVVDPSDENCRSCGSFFLNPIVTPAELAEIERRVEVPSMPRYPQPDGRTKLSAAWLLERAGLGRGERSGAVGLSTRHSLALVCHEGARASDVIAFARKLRRRVADRFGVSLRPEPQFWGFHGIDSEGLPDERLA
jgi:UDP-N-acetylmuramate dehydrogenase